MNLQEETNQLRENFSMFKAMVIYFDESHQVRPEIVPVKTKSKDEALRIVYQCYMDRKPKKGLRFAGVIVF